MLQSAPPRICHNDAQANSTRGNRSPGDYDLLRDGIDMSFWARLPHNTDVCMHRLQTELDDYMASDPIGRYDSSKQEAIRNVLFLGLSASTLRNPYACA